MDPYSYLSNAESGQIESLYDLYKQDPEKLDAGWRMFFEGFEFRNLVFKSHEHQPGMLPDEFKVINLINAYRQRGHLFTLTNPVRTRRQYSPTLALEHFGLSENDLNREFEAGQELGLAKTSLANILSHLQQTYCQSIGVEYMYIRRPDILHWLQQRMESTRNQPNFTSDEKQHIFRKLSEAVLFEKFLHKKYPGQKRFSLEGSESLIPALDAVVEKGSALGSEEFFIGMAHRGRLNVLANVMHKSHQDIFTEFEGKEYQDEYLMGDVKYHLGYTSERLTALGKKVRLSLSPNPSHLEAVNPVVEGLVRARINHIHKGEFNKITPILIHGDASLAGQGIIYEVLQMSELPGYKTGGSIHLVVNNQIGFTTNYLDGRSSIYCTDIAKIIQCPIFHVNADDVEAVVFTIRLAMEFRNQFGKDVFVDLLGYRKYGHNESDEPRFTQPILYKAIEQHPDPRQIYFEKLLSQGFLNKKRAVQLEDEINNHLEQHLTQAKELEKSKVYSFLEESWKHIRKATGEDFESSPETGVALSSLKLIGEKLTSLPPDRKFFRKAEKIQADRRNMLEKGDALDWAMAELLAYGSLLVEKIPVRISGQDVQRGTFSHRHAVFTVEDTTEYHIPLKHLSDEQATFDIYNSLLSEYGVLGFDYGYSLAVPDGLTVWEAQFGDFSNGAQIIFDQYISCAEEKWKVMSGLVVLLPHGYEGQGPEHSSGRMERFLTLCADGNIQIANCTTPANFFHLLRRQIHREFRKPLIVFTPKSLLRHPSCVSPLTEFSRGGFREVIDDTIADPGKVKRVLFCSGKIYYELLEEKLKTENDSVAIIRIEQLYPFPHGQLQQLISRYPLAERYVWVQEEPANMGAWNFILRNFKEVELLMVARPESGSPATGSGKLHLLRQRKIVEKAFGECECGRVKDVCRMLCAPKEWAFIGTKNKTKQ
ncbi:MAG TPA: 2-oxoglutarate dehydrogenase E1 component [Bacteroidales bacterium]|nr:2-oxoglutarate dehydrogenase E1 component [Bacteroidales bacterium]HSA43885.1 2-oxoglutarate dehydrogenase E1 component [Bacteroidales bacterium]